MLNYIVRAREVIAVCWLQFDIYIKKPGTYSPKSLYRHHGVRIYDSSKQEECSHLMPASLVYCKCYRVFIALFVEYPEEYP